LGEKMMFGTILDRLVDKQRLAAKNVTKAKNKLNEINQEIIQEVGIKDEGTVTKKTRLHKVSVIGKKYRRINQSALERLKSQFDDSAFKKLFRQRYEVNTSDMREAEKNQPTLMKLIEQAVNVSNATPSVKIELLS
jgi:hypothetical protein